jgi:imidazolonepropionase-like amidohydrolase
MLFAIAVAVVGPSLTATAEYTAIYGTVIDGSGADPILDGVVVVLDDWIVTVGSSSEVIVPEGARKIRVSHATILPGFINAHVHKSYDARTLGDWAANGVTTVRDLGGSVDIDWDAVRDELARNSSVASLIVSGPLLTIPDGYALVHPLNCGVAVASLEDARILTRQIIQDGVDIIKIAIDSQAPGEEAMPLDVARAIVETAHEHDISVIVHAIYNEDLMIAVEAGVDQLAHVIKGAVRVATIQTMVERGIIMTSTLAITGSSGSAHLRNFFASGGIVAMGTDAGAMGPVVAEMPIDEFRRMMRSGMDPMSVIIACTRNGALACGIEEEVGTLEIGKFADILVVEGNPLEDIAVLGEAVYVMHHGTVVHNESQAE